MKITVIFLLSFLLLAVISGNVARYPKQSRPTTFQKDVRDFMVEVAKANGYTGKFDRCHIVHWDFMATMIQKYENGEIDDNRMKQFIMDLAIIHRDASYYQALPPSAKDELKELTDKYKKEAKHALLKGDMVELVNDLYNMPSNLYPGDLSNNRSIKNRLDPPKKESASGGRSDQATRMSKNLLKKYKGDGLAIYNDPSSPGKRAKSSDKPPGDTSGDFVTIAGK